MNSTSKRQSILNNIREFLAFLAGLWGSLSSLTLLFPMSNYLIKVIPADNQNFPVFTVTATISSVFVLLYTYVSRDIYLENYILTTELNKRLTFTALISFVVGIFSIPVYLVIYYSFHPLLDDGNNFLKWMGLLSALAFYSMTFVFLTNSFTRLALSEYLKHTTSYASALENIWLNNKDWKKVSVKAIMNSLSSVIIDYYNLNQYKIGELLAHSFVISKIEPGYHSKYTHEGDRLFLRIFLLSTITNDMGETESYLKREINSKITDSGLTVGEVDIAFVNSEDEIQGFRGIDVKSK